MSFDNYRDYARSIVEMAVKSCSKAFFAIAWMHGKSPCFPGCGFSVVVDVDSVSVDFAVVDVEEILE
ncbi:hypothetical protein MUP38_06310 [Candidatus Bathyarchaeota archaeon]|nr:hypothetical protein [Candidatus Bathyarchaeota archaeon]